jgi:hypothetical protein
MRDPTEDKRMRNPGGSRGFRTGLERYPRPFPSADSLRAGGENSETSPCGPKTSAGKGVATYS